MLRLALVLALAALWAGGSSGASTAAGTDPIVGRWEFALPDGSPFEAGPVYDIVATGNGTFTTRVVRNWPIGCQAFDGQLRFSRIPSPASQSAYRGTATVLAPPLCKQSGEVEIELVLGANRLLRVFFKDATGLVQHYRSVSLRVDEVLLTFRERAEKAIAELRGRVQALAGRWEEIERSMPRLRREADERSDPTATNRRIAAIERELASVEKNLRRVEAAIAQSPNDPKVAAIRDAWEKRAFKLRSEQTKLELSLVIEEGRRVEAEAALQRALAERSRLDAELLALGRRIAGRDFDINEITARSGGRVVFRATADTKTARRLRELDADIAVAERAVAGLERERAAAKKAFLDAQKDVIAAGDRLIATFWSNFAKTAAIETGFLVLDLGVATLRGGFIGLAAEVAGKTVETATFFVLDEVFPSKGGGGDDVEAELRELYGAKLDDSLSGSKVARTAFNRTVKETVLKAGVKDPLRKLLVKTVFDPARYETVFDAAGAALAREPTRARLKELERSVGALLRARGRLEDFTARQKLKPSKLRGLAQNVAKDVAKAVLKRQLELAEREAWLDYFERDLQARAYFPLLQTASTRYWEAKDGLDALVAERATLLAARPDLKILVSEPFPRGVPLRISLAGRGAPGPIGVVLGGARAGGGNRFVYDLDTTAVQPSSAGKVVLEIR